jgi:Na+/H+ antiporter NhaD/arsenite permease-like protein
VLRRVISILLINLVVPAALIADEKTAYFPDTLAALPFVLLLVSIAVLPLISHRWWERSYPAISIGLGAFTGVYYAFFLHNPAPMVASLEEYAGFILLLGSLFIVTGGIHLHAGWKGSTGSNLILLALGAVLSNLIGTTGASMLLIRPFLQTNRGNVKAYHVVFFIMLVGNIGGALTPIGDPPLYLGYLRGVPLLWTFTWLGVPWLVATGALLLFFGVIDAFRKPKKEGRTEDFGEGVPRRFRVEGGHNIIFLAMIVGSFFTGANWGVRAGLMMAAGGLSYLTTPAPVHRMNRYTFLPMKETAILFFGIFLTMVPALEWLSEHAGTFGLVSPQSYYWGTGLLSSFLDNAPTYLAFTSAATGTFVPSGIPDAALHLDLLVRHAGMHLAAISAGAVFFGGMTYIGNGPNFLIRAIAIHAGVPMPSFGAYIFRYAIPVLLPVCALVWYLFFR